MLVVIIILCYLLRPNNKYSPPPTVEKWLVNPSSDPERNTCQVYTFPTQLYDNKFVFPNPSLATVNLLQGTDNYPSCLSGNQIVAQQVTRTCVTGGCIDSNGNDVPIGTTETYYRNCNNLASCSGSLSLLNINYNGNACIANISGEARMLPCDPTDSRQIMRITRHDPGVDSSTIVGAGGLRGLEGIIKNGNSCLQVSNQIGTSISTCGSSLQTNGKKLSFGACNDNYWYLRPSSPNCPQGKTQFDVCCDNTKPDCVSGTPVGNDATIIPCCQSIPPQITTKDNEAIYYGGTGDVILTIPSTDDEGCEGKNYVSRNLNIATYLTSLQQLPCISGVSQCTPL
jgi:hypothetical protein